MPIQQNLPTNEPEMKDLLDVLRKQIFLDLNCHHVATIQSFDKATQTATATINYQKTYFEQAADGTYKPVLVPYPIAAKCPCFVLGGGDAALTFPIQKGDECVILYNDRDLDTWFTGGSSSSPNNTPRLHSFSDGMILVGLRSMANVLADYDDDGAALRMGDTKVKVDGENVIVTTLGLTATFRPGGGARLENAIGFFDFNDDADITFDTGTVQGRIGHGGHLKFTNALGELIQNLIQLFTDVATGQTAVGPLVMPTFAADILILESFLDP